MFVIVGRGSLEINAIWQMVSVFLYKIYSLSAHSAGSYPNESRTTNEASLMQKFVSFLVNEIKQ